VYKLQISNSDSVHPVKSAQYLSKQPQGLNLFIMHNIREIELKGFDKANYLFKLSIASLLILESLTIENCPGLGHIIDIDDEYDKENLIAVFPKLRKFSVRDCGQLKYMLGQYPMANQDYKEIRINFLALETLSLDNLPNFVSICDTNSLTMTCPSLKKFQCHGCSSLFYDSVNCLMVPMDSREPIGTSRKVVLIFIIISYFFPFVFCLDFFTFSIMFCRIQKGFRTISSLYKLYQ